MQKIIIALSKKDYFESTKELKKLADINPIANITPYLNQFEKLKILKTRYNGRKKEIYEIKKDKVKKIFFILLNLI